MYETFNLEMDSLDQKNATLVILPLTKNIKLRLGTDVRTSDS